MTPSSEARELAVEAHIYLYPLVTMDVSCRIMWNVPPDTVPANGPMGAIHHMRALPDANFKAGSPELRHPLLVGAA